jgi:hypothetical protein
MCLADNPLRLGLVSGPADSSLKKERSLVTPVLQLGSEKLQRLKFLRQNSFSGVVFPLFSAHPCVNSSGMWLPWVMGEIVAEKLEG